MGGDCLSRRGASTGSAGLEAFGVGLHLGGIGFQFTDDALIVEGCGKLPASRGSGAQRSRFFCRKSPYRRRNPEPALRRVGIQAVKPAVQHGRLLTYAPPSMEAWSNAVNKR